MMYSRRFENGAQDMDRRGVEHNAPLQQERNVTRKKMVTALVVLIAGALMLPTHEALARGGGGFGGDQGGGSGGGLHGRASARGFHGDDFGGSGNREVEFGGRGLSHLTRGRRFDHRGQVGDPYWTPCNYSSSYGTDSCGG
jgi:hypothetical protein